MAKKTNTDNKKSPKRQRRAPRAAKGGVVKSVALPKQGPSAEEVVREAIRDSYQGEYKDLVERWRDMERKAQGVVTIAGIFIAATFVFVEQGFFQ